MALDTSKVINRAQFTEIQMTAGVIARVNELGFGKPELLTWTTRQGEIIGDGPLWDTTETRNDNAILPAPTREQRMKMMTMMSSLLK